jgi:sensor domain CHASE-containing protein
VNLRTRLIIIFGVFLALEICFFYSLYKWDLSPKIDRLESEIVEKNLSRNMELLQRELFHLERTGWLLSSLELIKHAVKNEIPAIMLQQDLNLLYIIDNNNQVIFGKILDLDSMVSYPNEKFLPALWKEKPQFIKPTSTPNAQIGIYNSVFGPLLIASLPIEGLLLGNC